MLGLEAQAAVVRSRIAVLLNASAGSIAKAPDREALRVSLERAFVSHHITAEIRYFECEALRACAEAARELALAGDIDAIVVGGGDGSIRTVAGVLADTGIPLGVLPLGTLNHFAKDNGIPVDPEAAAAVIALGQVRAVDLAEVNGEIFINNASIGVYPYLVTDRERLRTNKGLSKWLATAEAFVRTLMHFPRRRLTVRAAGWTRPYRTPCLFVGNNRYSMELFTLGRRSRMDAGELWLYVVKQRRPLGFLWMVARLCLGRIDEARDIEIFNLGEAEVVSRASRLPVAFDGEVEIMRTPLKFRSRPGELRVIVPTE